MVELLAGRVGRGHPSDRFRGFAVVITVGHGLAIEVWHAVEGLSLYGWLAEQSELSFSNCAGSGDSGRPNSRNYGQFG